MSKRVVINDTVIIGGHDISDWVHKWQRIRKVGDIAMLELDVMPAYRRAVQPITITDIEMQQRIGAAGMSLFDEAFDAVVDATVNVVGNDMLRKPFNLAPWVYGFDYRYRVGHAPITRLYLHDDTEVITIHTPDERVHP